MTTTRVALSAALMALLITAIPSIAQAQDKSRSRGFFIGASLDGNGVSFEDAGDAESGAGFGITFGYGFTPKLALYGQWTGASIDSVDGDYGLGHFDLGLRVHFRAPAKTVVPYVQAGLSGRALRQDLGFDTIEASGGGFAFGGGIDAHFNPALAFNAGVTWSVGNLSKFKLNGATVPVDSFGMTTARVYFGLIWFVQKK